ncbi:MAG: HRDC domain-containing protein [Proteobacteria bacterium]|nr:HRDC domain-containing protein [Pseudomonadota bacterium]
MKLHFFTISSQAPEQGQEALNAFCAQHRVVSLEKQFVTQGMESYWSICVTTLDGAGVERTNDSLTGRRDRIDYKEILSEQDFSVYAELRNLRKSLAEQEGVPAYALFTNEQLAAMVTQRVQTLAALGAIEGVGKARLEKYGAIFLNVLQSALAGRPPVSDASPAH